MISLIVNISHFQNKIQLNNNLHYWGNFIMYKTITYNNSKLEDNFINNSK